MIRRMLSTALPLVGLAGVAAHAQTQSNVILYGVVDAGVEYATHLPAGNHSALRLQDSNAAGSRWGLRGVESLGNGYQGIFVLESGFSLDTGVAAQGGRLFGRQAFVGLGTKNSQLLFGRQYSVNFAYALIFDPMLLAPRYSIASNDNPGGPGTRYDNSVKYTGNYGPVYTEITYSFGVDGTSGLNGEVPGNSKVGREYGALLSYSGNNFDLGAIYEEIAGSTVATVGDKTRRASAAGSLTFGPAKAFVGYRYLSTERGPVTSRADLYWAGAKWKIYPAFTLAAAAYYTNSRASGADPWMFTVAGTYAFSKRTSLYAAGAYARNKEGSNLGVGGYGTVMPGENQLGVVLAIRHSF